MYTSVGKLSSEIYYVVVDNTLLECMCLCSGMYCMHICIWCVYVRMYLCIYVCTYVCMYECVCTISKMHCMYLCVYVRMYLCICVCTYVCIYECMYVPFANTNLLLRLHWLWLQQPPFLTTICIILFIFKSSSTLYGVVCCNWIVIVLYDYNEGPNDETHPGFLVRGLIS